MVVGSTEERLRATPYHQRVCRIETYPHSLMLPPRAPPGHDGMPIPDYVTMMADAGCQVHVVAAAPESGQPRFNSRLLPGVTAAEDLPGASADPLSEFIELAHERGIVVLSSGCSHSRAWRSCGRSG